MADKITRTQAVAARPFDTLDLTRAEVDLRESELLFRALAENVEVVFYVHEIDQQRISYVSPACERIWGQSASEIYADPVAFLRDIHAEDRPQVEIALTHQRAGENTETRYRLVLPGGGIRHIPDPRRPWPHRRPPQCRSKTHHEKRKRLTPATAVLTGCLRGWSRLGLCEITTFDPR